MTYRELLEQLEQLPEHRLDDTVTVYEPYEDEYIAITETSEASHEHCNVLDDGHFYLILKA